MTSQRIDPELPTPVKPDQRYVKLAGLVLVCAGLVFALDQSLHTGWLALLVVPLIGSLGFAGGVRQQRMAWIIPGALAAGLGLSGLALLGRIGEVSTPIRIGLALFFFGFGWICIFLVSLSFFRPRAWWALITGMIIGCASLPFLLDRVTIFDFVLTVGTGLGIGLLAWGYFERLFGLIIPGCLLVGIGPGIYYAWSGVTQPNGLTETGIMLVWFALGWGLITVFGKIVLEKLIWWPIIPGGLLAVVGWGLYIGGSPDNALAFIGNTGTIGLIIFGLYLLLLKRSFKG